MKKNIKEPVLNNLELVVNELESSIVDLLYLENKIDYKKKKNIKLSEDEHFFDTYIVKPSFMLRILERRDKNKNKE